MKNNSQTIRDLNFYLINNFGDKLSKSDINEIFAFLLKVDYKQILTMYENKLDEDVLKQFYKIVDEIKLNKPIAYILGKKYFYNQEFLVNNNVLIPREDSEVLVEQALIFLNKNYINDPAIIVDLCTGTGNLGLSVANNRKINDQYILTDISSTAVENVTDNIKFLKLSQKSIKVLTQDFLNVFSIIPKANLIISNPPYIAVGDKNLDQSVYQYEPHQALFADNEGLKFYQEIFEHYQEIFDLTKPFMLLMEFGFEQKKAIEQIFHNLPANHQIEFLRDNNGNWRAFKLYNK